MDEELEKKIIDMRNWYFSISYGESGSDVYVGDEVHFSRYALDESSGETTKRIVLGTNYRVLPYEERYKEEPTKEIQSSGYEISLADLIAKVIEVPGMNNKVDEGNDKNQADLEI